MGFTFCTLVCRDPTVPFLIPLPLEAPTLVTQVLLGRPHQGQQSIHTLGRNIRKAESHTSFQNNITDDHFLIFFLHLQLNRPTWVIRPGALR